MLACNKWLQFKEAIDFSNFKFLQSRACTPELPVLQNCSWDEGVVDG